MTYLRNRPPKSAAYERAIRPYLAESESAGKILSLIYSRLKPVEGSRLVLDVHGFREHLHQYNYAGLVGYLTDRVDSHGRLVFVIYKRSDVAHAQTLTFTRRKDRYPVAPRPLFLTAPEVWAHLNGHEAPKLRPDEYAKWRTSLEEAAGLDDEDRELDRRYTLSLMPHPEKPFPVGDGKSVSARFAWEFLAYRLKRKLSKRRRKLMYDFYNFFVDKWHASALSTVSGFPCAIKAADTYLGKCFGIGRDTAARVVKDLERLGYVQAVMCTASDKWRGIYWYFPGLGFPPPWVSRRPDITAQGALAWMRQYYRYEVRKVVEQESLD